MIKRELAKDPALKVGGRRAPAVGNARWPQPSRVARVPFAALLRARGGHRGPTLQKTPRSKEAEGGRRVQAPTQPPSPSCQPQEENWERFLPNFKKKNVQRKKPKKVGGHPVVSVKQGAVEPQAPRQATEQRCRVQRRSQGAQERGAARQRRRPAACSQGATLSTRTALTSLPLPSPPAGPREEGLHALPAATAAQVGRGVGKRGN